MQEFVPLYKNSKKVLPCGGSNFRPSACMTDTQTTCLYRLLFLCQNDWKALHESRLDNLISGDKIVLNVLPSLRKIRISS